jgi:glycosyltransferase involved in cell wall biosynthesis
MDAVRQRIVELGLEQAVDLRGQVADVAPCLIDARVFVLTSRSEGLSIAMVEAMVCGAVPVVANVGDLADLVADGQNGFLIEPGNVEQYAERAVALLSDRERWRRLSAEASRCARAYNGLERVAALWHEHLAARLPAERDGRHDPVAAAVDRVSPRLAPDKDAGR